MASKTTKYRLISNRFQERQKQILPALTLLNCSRQHYRIKVHMLHACLKNTDFEPSRRQKTFLLGWQKKISTIMLPNSRRQASLEHWTTIVLLTCKPHLFTYEFNFHIIRWHEVSFQNQLVMRVICVSYKTLWCHLIFLIWNPQYMPQSTLFSVLHVEQQFHVSTLHTCFLDVHFHSKKLSICCCFLT